MAKLIDLKISCFVKMLQHEYMTKMLFILQYRLSVLLLITERKVQTLTLPPQKKRSMNYNPKSCNHVDRQNIPVIRKLHKNAA